MQFFPDGFLVRNARSAQAATQLAIVVHHSRHGDTYLLTYD